MSKAMKSSIAIATGVAILGGAFATAGQAFAWGPERDTYTWQDVNSEYFAGNWPKDKIVFNSITNTPNFGDERNFVAAREYNGDDNGFKNEWYGTSIDVKDGQTYKLRLYVHNNSPHGYEGVATNVRTFFSIPQVSSKEIKVTGFITADNAAEIWDSVTMKSDQAFHLEYVYGSAVLENGKVGQPQNGKTGYSLGDNVVTDTKGALIGYDAIDGRIPGCYEYASYVTIEVKAVYDTDHLVEKKVRLAGTTEWSNEIDAKIGDEVEFQIQYKNLTNGDQMNVMMKDILPKNMEYVPNSTILFNADHKKGFKMSDDGITSTGVNIGNYGPNSNAYVRFTAKVVDNTLQCGGNILGNWAQVGVGKKTIQDYALVNVAKVCTAEKEIPNTGPETLAGGIITTGSIVTAAGYYLVSRRSLR